MKNPFKRLSRMRDDYLDWARIRREFNFVAIDAVDIGHWKAGVPVAYQREPAFDGKRWLRSAPDIADMAGDVPEYVNDKAIIGPLPKPEASLRRRPIIT